MIFYEINKQTLRLYSVQEQRSCHPNRKRNLDHMEFLSPDGCFCPNYNKSRFHHGSVVIVYGEKLRGEARSNYNVDAGFSSSEP